MSEAASIILRLFAKYPVPGYAKTRLIPALGEAGAAALHRTLAHRTCQTLIASEQPVVVHYAGAEETAFREWLGDMPDYAEQPEGDLTDRLLAALGSGPQIFFGADTPDLTVAIVEQAVAALATHDVVIGPAEDGGYYLIGMARPLPELFCDMPWSTDKVLPTTLVRLKAMGIVPAVLDTLADCDRPEDLTRWPELVKSLQP
ncbi:TIGR04282 family arsenosugar biosynthesis glycosyltransferase [Alterisphingorhabdus coralli]|uniref:TIGR04282 family arsenosugar biosynthesis glycosyltransferase n=1 Tax=Alterisphingorhabdus coralli TaxID=3071408 RepID=A0AA97I084_9SPHN|nr:TIGR04282 family arsenosugar biosynthesis glycosyltransferase [Parasphingorhabdus sp. SCSIO 66989]WOE74627.1 TIGR04282 family arsenosugar biosynthesis glycosyltransferase [Parasphingorhabdus sp. SCSIO 66989]